MHFPPIFMQQAAVREPMPDAALDHSQCIAGISEGFAPVAGIDATVLILGSLPSRKSLQAQEYYAHPRNAFWKIMADLYGAGPELAYEARCERLVRRNVAIWDVLRSSRRAGSLDAAIDLDASKANDFKGFFESHKQIDRVYCNGRKAAELYRRLVTPALPVQSRCIACMTLPSTSPAHAAMPYDEKLEIWRQVM